MSDCLFCKIAAGEIPSTCLYNDDDVYAFRDINPQMPVHFLVIPKQHIDAVASITADKVKIPRRWDDSFSAFNGVVQQSGMDLARYKGKTVEKWSALLPAASSGETSRYGVLLVYKKKAVGAYLLEKPSGTVLGLQDAQNELAKQTSGEDYSGDWGERHDEQLTDSTGEPEAEPEAAPQAAPYTELPLDAEGYPVE